jgi:hypothetical protein
MEKVDWVYNEFNSITFGDKRLDDRLRLTASCLYSFPLSPINKACGSWAQTKAAYNLFHNKKCDSNKIFFEHQKKTFSRITSEIKKGSLIIVPQDTTYFNYTHHPKVSGLAKITTVGGKKILGFLMHSSIALTDEGLPLGIIDQDIYTREQKGSNKNRTHKNLPIDQKESFYWIQHLETLVHLKDDYNVVSVCDREGDIYEYIQMATDFGIDFVVRSGRDRILLGENKTISTHLKGLKAKGSVTLEVESKKTRKKRTAKFKLFFDKVCLRPTQRVSQSESIKLEPQEIFIVYVKELNPPQGEERMEWILVTNRQVLNLESAKLVVKIYKMRWDIESWHKVIKSGFKAEDCRLEDYSRLKKYVCLISILAWKILYLVKLKRTHPNLECTYVFNEIEWKALYFKIYRSFKFPTSPPKIKEVIVWIGILGGFLNRKKDGDPGMTVLWRGMQRLSDAIDDYMIFRKEFMGNS